MKNSVKNEILGAAMPHLAGKAVRDIVIGISLVGCELSDGSIGVAYVLRENLPAGCGFGFAGDMLGAPAAETARLFTEGDDDLRRALGNAVLTAAVSGAKEICDDTSNHAFGIEPTENDTVGMVGLIKPVAKQMAEKAGKLIVFDEGAYRDGENVYATELEAELLPKCSKVIITGSSTINGSIDGLLEMCKNAKKTVIVGSSTPMISAGWKNTNVTALAGTYWKKECKEEIFRTISLGGGISQLKKYSEKKIVNLK